MGTGDHVGALSNALVTGPPRSGKTTALERTVSRVRDQGYTVSGLYSPERREDGKRIGFEIVGLESGRREVMAHVDRDEGPCVGKYRVDVSAVDRLTRAELSRSTAAETDCIVIDEIAPMQLESDLFIEATRAVLESPIPVLAAVKAGSTDGVLGEVKSRDDVETFAVETATRDVLPDRLVEWVRVRV